MQLRTLAQILNNGYWVEMDLRNNEIEVLRAGEIADARVSDVGGLVSRDDVVPYTHLLLFTFF